MSKLARLEQYKETIRAMIEANNIIGESMTEADDLFHVSDDMDTWLQDHFVDLHSAFYGQMISNDGAVEYLNDALGKVEMMVCRLKEKNYCEEMDKTNSAHMESLLSYLEILEKRYNEVGQVMEMFHKDVEVIEKNYAIDNFLMENAKELFNWKNEAMVFKDDLLGAIGYGMSFAKRSIENAKNIEKEMGEVEYPDKMLKDNMDRDDFNDGFVFNWGKKLTGDFEMFWEHPGYVSIVSVKRDMQIIIGTCNVVLGLDVATYSSQLVEEDAKGRLMYGEGMEFIAHYKTKEEYSQMAWADVLKFCNKYLTFYGVIE